jgi:hypothetical protein
VGLQAWVEHLLSRDQILADRIFVQKILVRLLRPSANTTAAILKFRHCQSRASRQEMKGKSPAIHFILSRLNIRLTDVTLPVCQIYRNISRSLLMALAYSLIQQPKSMTALHRESRTCRHQWIYPGLTRFWSRAIRRTQQKGLITLSNSGHSRVDELPNHCRLLNDTAFEFYRILETSDTYEPREESKHNENLKMKFHKWKCVWLPEKKDVARSFFLAKDIAQILTMLTGRICAACQY